jgi:outer membrane biogenesis lipoprotein LolB
MNTITKLAFIATAVAALANSVAMADNSTLRQQIDLQRQQIERNKTMTIAVYANRHGVGQGAMDQRTETRFEWRTNANGQRFGLYVPVK